MDGVPPVPILSTVLPVRCKPRETNVNEMLSQITADTTDTWIHHTFSTLQNYTFETKRETFIL